jgi:adenine deaminase
MPDQTNVKNSKSLVDTAMGRQPASLVIRGGIWVCVQTGEVIPHTDVAVCGERIAYVGPDASHTIGAGTRVIDAHGSYLVPGLLDGHMHVESGQLSVTEFVRAVLPHGTTGMFIDPHEIANVFGLKGVKMMVDEALLQPNHVFVQVPSCVPSAPGLETPGSELSAADVAEAMQLQGVIGLGEVMYFPGVINGDDKMHAEMASAREAGKVIGGHYASADLGLPFHGYVAGGAQDDHEGTTLQDALQRARQGMKVLIRHGSGCYDVATQVKAVTELGLDSRHLLLCTDDSHAQTLVEEGHMDRVIRHAINRGLPPVKAIAMATINTAEHFGVSLDMGLIAPGRFADILLVDELSEFTPRMVMAKGKVAAENGRLLLDMPEVNHPDWAKHSVNLPRRLEARDFKLNTADGKAITANVIGVVESQSYTRHLKLKVDVKDGEISAGPADLAKLFLLERHHNTGRMQSALVQGFGFTRPCAVASTVAHDSHHMLVAGTDNASMAVAANALAECGGGQVVVLDGKVIGKVELPIAGLMSDEAAHIVAGKSRSVLNGFKACGCTLNNPNMQLSMLALVVIPELRISDLGLVDVNQFRFILAFDTGLAK